MSTSTRYHLQRAALVAALVVCASLLGAAVAWAQSAGEAPVVPGVPGGQVTIVGSLLGAILWLARRLEARPTQESLSRAHTEIDALRVEARDMRSRLDEMTQRALRAEMRVEMLRPAAGAGGPL